MKHKFTHSRHEYGYVVGTIPGIAWFAGFAVIYGIFVFATTVGQTAAVLLSMGLAALPALAVRIMLTHTFIAPTDKESSADAMRQIRGEHRSVMRDLGSDDRQ